jgi:hypothetical protein
MECSRTVSNYAGPQFRDVRMAWMYYLGRPSWTEDLAAGEISRRGSSPGPAARDGLLEADAEPGLDLADAAGPASGAVVGKMTGMLGVF